MKECVQKRIGGTVRLSIEDRVEAAKEMHASGMCQSDIAEVLGVGQSTLSKDLNANSKEYRAEDKTTPAYSNEYDERSVGARVSESLRAEVDLKQETDHGITDKEAFKRLGKFWANVTKNQNDKAHGKLARRVQVGRKLNFVRPRRALLRAAVRTGAEASTRT
jgi:predicted transcriptional regulator